MTYIQLSLWFLAAAAVAAVVLSALTPKPRVHVGAVVLTIATLFVLTAVFDTIMIGSGLFHYAPSHLLGVFIGLAPVEDFTYPLAGALLLPTLWTALRARRARTARRTELSEETA